MYFFKCPICNKIMVSKEEHVTCCGNVLNNLEEQIDFNEKHTPCYEINNNGIKVFVNHGMTPEHYIEFIAISYDDDVEIIHLNHNDVPTKIFNISDSLDNIKLYAYCNTHGLFANKVK